MTEERSRLQLRIDELSQQNQLLHDNLDQVTAAAAVFVAAVAVGGVLMLQLPQH